MKDKNNLYLVSDEETGPLFIVATSMQRAIERWRKWMFDQSDGTMGELSHPDIEPPNISLLATHDEVLAEQPTTVAVRS